MFFLHAYILQAAPQFGSRLSINSLKEFIKRFAEAPKRFMYIDIKEDSLNLYPMVAVAGATIPNTLHKKALGIPVEQDRFKGETYVFSKSSFDLDVLTVPFKYRPGTSGIPHQLSTSFQGAVYVGLRNDLFRIGYKRTPLRNYKRCFNRFGYSMGLFSGLGSSVINESVTANQVGYEYDGVIFLNGLAGIIGINNFTLV